MLDILVGTLVFAGMIVFFGVIPWYVGVWIGNQGNNP